MTTREVMFDSVEDVNGLSSRARSSRKILTCAAAAAWWTEVHAGNSQSGDS